MMTYLIMFLSMLFISIALGGLWIVLNYYIEIKLTPKCLWCGEEKTVHSLNKEDIEECIENTIPSAVR